MYPKSTKAKVIVGILGVMASVYLLSSMNQKTDRNTIRRGLNNAELQASSKLPIVVDELTLLTNLTFQDNDPPRMEYEYKVGFTLRNIKDDMGISAWTKNTKMSLINTVCGSKKQRDLVDANVELVFKYVGRDGVQIGWFMVEKSDCH